MRRIAVFYREGHEPYCSDDGKYHKRFHVYQALAVKRVTDRIHHEIIVYYSPDGTVQRIYMNDVLSVAISEDDDPNTPILVCLEEYIVRHKISPDAVSPQEEIS